MKQAIIIFGFKGVPYMNLTIDGPPIEGGTIFNFDGLQYEVDTFDEITRENQLQNVYVKLIGVIPNAQ